MLVSTVETTRCVLLEIAAKMLKCTIFYLIFMAFLYADAAMNEKQLKSTAKLMRNTCQPKTKVTDEMIDNMHKGVWGGDPTEKCYMLCVLATAKITKKNGEIDYEESLPQIVNLPEPRQAATNATLFKCKDELVTDDKCDNGWRVAKCFYDDNASNYFLP